MAQATSRPAPPQRHRLARALCALLALLGALPLLLDGVMRLPWVRTTLAAKASALLESALGVDATFRTELHVLPLELVLYDLRVAATDGPEPALFVPRVRVAPSFVALLAGSLDVGDVQLERPRVRLVLGEGGLRNVRFRAPEGPSSSPPSPPPKRLPFRSIALRGADVDLRVEAAALDVSLRGLDVEVGASEGPVLDLALRLAGGELHRRRLDGEGAEVVDDDALCRLSLRAHGGLAGALVHRFDLDLRLDADPAPGATPGCGADPPADGRLALALDRLRIEPGAGPLPKLAGRVELAAPARIAGRIAPKAPPLAGSVALEADIDYDGALALPSARGAL
ncbi:MAG TPA: hypothetical protein VFS00_05135, partial [Polyangiaceae bacterium]|nr:hypothetical protein [Polyangiaceae bacterium]